MTNNCIFCSIAKKEVPSFKIYETANFLAFLDIYPLSEGHTVIIPKMHYPDVWSVPYIEEYMRICKLIANRFQSITGNKKVYSFVLGNEVPHASIHIIPNINTANYNSFGAYHARLIQQFKREDITDFANKIQQRYKLP